MHGVLTHPAREPFGPTSLRWSTFSPAGRKEGGRIALAVVDWRRCRVWMRGGLTHPSFASLADPLSGRPERGWKVALTVVDWRKSKVWMHGVLTHPPKESLGPTLLRWSTFSPAGRKEGREKKFLLKNDILSSPPRSRTKREFDILISTLSALHLFPGFATSSTAFSSDFGPSASLISCHTITPPAFCRA
jgi:hypothetical protein